MLKIYFSSLRRYAMFGLGLYNALLPQFLVNKLCNKSKVEIVNIHRNKSKFLTQISKTSSLIWSAKTIDVLKCTCT